MPERPPPPDECANCGATLPRTARACPDCGADERTGWRDNDDTRYDGLDLPDSAFDDASAPNRRPPPIRRVNGIAWYWYLAGVLVLLALVLGVVSFR